MATLLSEYTHGARKAHAPDAASTHNYDMKTLVSDSGPVLSKIQKEAWYSEGLARGATIVSMAHRCANNDNVMHGTKGWRYRNKEMEILIENSTQSCKIGRARVTVLHEVRFSAQQGD